MTIETAFWILLVLLVAVSVWTLLRMPRPSRSGGEGELSTLPEDEPAEDPSDEEGGGPGGPFSPGSGR